MKKAGKFVLRVALIFIGQIANVIGLLWALLATLAFSDRADEIILGYDHLGNAVTGGVPEETISRRANRNKKERKWACVLCKVLDWLDKGHCERAGE